MIITGKKKKKYFDDYGDEITDETLLIVIANGKTVISYNEYKSGEDTYIDARNKRVIRTKRKNS